MVDSTTESYHKTTDRGPQTALSISRSRSAVCRRLSDLQNFRQLATFATYSSRLTASITATPAILTISRTSSPVCRT